MKNVRDSYSRRFGHRSIPAPGVGVLAAVEGAMLIVWHLIATPLVGRRRLAWGTVGTETNDTLPGDELVPKPKWSYTLGITIDASPEDVWPWIAQLGQGRGGFYTYQTLENMAGCKITNTTEILPDHQHPAVGDGIYLHPTAPPLRIEAVDPPNALVLLGSPVDMGAEESWGTSTWQFVVNSGPGGGSRLLTRGRYDYATDWKSSLAFGRFPIEAITFVMSRKMMLEIKRLAEDDAWPTPISFPTIQEASVTDGNDEANQPEASTARAVNDNTTTVKACSYGRIERRVWERGWK